MSLCLPPLIETYHEGEKSGVRNNDRPIVMLAEKAFFYNAAFYIEF